MVNVTIATITPSCSWVLFCGILRIRTCEETSGDYAREVCRPACRRPEQGAEILDRDHGLQGHDRSAIGQATLDRARHWHVSNRPRALHARRPRESDRNRLPGFVQL